MDRRDFLRTAGATAIAVGAAGCSTSDSGTAAGGENGYPYPSIPERALDGWTLSDRRATDEQLGLGGVALDRHTRTVIYEFTRLSESVREKTLGEFEGEMSAFFASRTAFEGYATSLVGPERVADEGLGEMTAEMESMGMTDVREVQPRDSRPTVADGQAFREVSGTYPVEDVSFETALPGNTRQTFEIEGGEVSVRGFLVAWKPDQNTAYVAGGAYPDGDFERESVESVTGGERGDGIDVTIQVDLNLDPEAYRAELIDLVERVA